MNITDLIWYENIVEKLARKHGVQIAEVQEVMYEEPHIRFVEKGQVENENIYSALGQTYGGRYLIVFFIYKKTGAH